MTETYANRKRRQAERQHNLSPKAGPLRFMGHEFPTIVALKAEYPAFADEGAIRAIRAINARGEMATVQTVEMVDADHKREAYRKSVAAARKSQFAAKVLMGDGNAIARARGGLATARKARSAPKSGGAAQAVSGGVRD